MLKNTIHEIAKGLKLPAPEAGENDEYTFIFDDVLEVDILSLKKDSLILAAPITDTLPSPPETEDFFKKILQWNFSRLKDYEEVLTWDPDSDSITLSKEIPFSELSEKPILGQLETFLNNLEFWKSAIAQKANSTISRLPQ